MDFVGLIFDVVILVIAGMIWFQDKNTLTRVEDLERQVHDMTAAKKEASIGGLVGGGN